MTCEFCGGEEFIELGQLGLRKHHRCRSCGMNRSELVVDAVIATSFGYRRAT